MKPDDVKYGYMCQIDFNYELGEAVGGTKVYPDIEDLKKDHPCFKTCGIVKVKITPEEYINTHENPELLK